MGKGDAESPIPRLERIRTAANEMERTLRAYRVLAARAFLAYRAVKGGRDWAVDEGRASIARAFPPELEGWLPPSPHRGIVLEWLGKGRLHLIASGSSSPPEIEFEDGGGIQDGTVENNRDPAG